MDASIITLTTDFGTSDPYVGVMKGVILGINPRVHLVDLCHDVQPQAIRQAAFLIEMSHRYFRQGTIHMVVADPGVGTSRRALLLVTPFACFVGPDNGVFSYILMEGFGKQLPAEVTTSHVPLPSGYRAYHLTNPKHWLHPVSSTFHGRDVFAPVAGHLSLGVAPQELGEEVGEVVCLPVSPPRWNGETLQGQVVHIDRFGNLITDIQAGTLPGDGSVDIQVKGRSIQGVNPSYAEGEMLLAVVGSYNTLEIAEKNGSAVHTLDASVGDTVRVVRQE